jgi:TIGR00730 family protein
MSPLRPFRPRVYSVSRERGDPAFVAAVRALGMAMAAWGKRLINGAGDVGMMGAVPDAAIAAGGRTLGVIPRHLQARERGKAGLTAYMATETMHERKKVMFVNADAVVALPGGPGTLDELFEALTWRQLGLHETPIWCVNVAGYWDPLLALVRHLHARGFCDASFPPMLREAGSVEALLAALTPCN